MLEYKDQLSKQAKRYLSADLGRHKEFDWAPGAAATDEEGRWRLIAGRDGKPWWVCESTRSTVFPGEVSVDVDDPATQGILLDRLAKHWGISIREAIQRVLKAWKKDEDLSYGALLAALNLQILNEGGENA